MLNILGRKVTLSQWSSRASRELDPKDYQVHREVVQYILHHLARMLAKDFKELGRIHSKTIVIADFQVNGVPLPVVQIQLPDGTVFVLRSNLNGWVISITRPEKLGNVEADFMGVFNPRRDLLDERLAPPNSEDHNRWEGNFPDDVVYQSYSKDKRQFTLALPKGAVHTAVFFWVYRYHVLGITKMPTFLH